MKFIIYTLLLLSYRVQASWGPLDIEETVCNNSTLIFVGTYDSVLAVDYYKNPDTGPYESYWYDLGAFTVDQVLKNNESETHLTDQQIIDDGVKMITDGRCEGSFCHMQLPLAVGQSGIWLVSLHGTNLRPIGHPSIPLPLLEKKVVEEALQKCTKNNALLM
jgi:hypothetical protein